MHTEDWRYPQVTKGLHVQIMHDGSTPGDKHLVKRLCHQYMIWKNIGTDLDAAVHCNTVTLCSYSTALSQPQTVK